MSQLKNPHSLSLRHMLLLLVNLFSVSWWALVRKLVGIETSGSLNTLLCDKTGTLTLGKLNVKYVVTKDNKIFKTIFVKNYYYTMMKEI